MLEVEPVIKTLDTESFIEISSELEFFFAQAYPQIELSSPLNEYDIRDKKNGMHEEEREIAMLLFQQGYLVYREPKFFDFQSTPDFFVFNQDSYEGVIVEITKLPQDMERYRYKKKTGRVINTKQRKQTKERKKRQEGNIKSCGIPYVILNREQIEEIRMKGSFFLFN